MKSSCPASSGFRRRVAGVIQQKDASNKVVASRKIFTDQELIVGRDMSRCQYILDDPFVSNKHLRIYTVVYENNVPSEVAPLVFAEDLSRNGTYWNGSLIGRGSGSFLLSNDDTLRLSSRTCFTFTNMMTEEPEATFDLIQEGEMRSFRNDYTITDRLLGAGAFGRVFMAIEQFQQKQLACKMVDLRRLRPQSRARIGRAEQPAHAEDVDNRKQLLKVKVWASQHRTDNRLDEKLKIYYREAEILASISHPNIIGLDKVFVTDNTIYMFQELVTAGDLFSYLERKNGKLLEVEAAATVRQMLLALEFLHKKNIVHRDLKPDNVLMTTLAVGCRVVLTDFGAARRVINARTRMSTIMGTVEYTAPEVLGQSKLPARKKGYTGAVDMWSLGCVTVVLLTGGTAFADPSTNDYSEKLANECDLTSLEESREWQEVSRRPKGFVNKLLVLEEQLRMTATEALQDAWFTNDVNRTDFEKLYQRTVQHWRPRIRKSPLIEFVDSYDVKHLPCSREVTGTERRNRKRSEIPVEPPYKPFPRNMYQPFFPKRKTEIFTMSKEESAAIQRNWSPSEMSRSSGRVPSPGLPSSPADARSGHKRLAESQYDGHTRTTAVDPQPTPPKSSRKSDPKTARRVASLADLMGSEKASLPLRDGQRNEQTTRGTSRGSPELGEPRPTSPLVVKGSVSVLPKEIVSKAKHVSDSLLPEPQLEKRAVKSGLSEPSVVHEKGAGKSRSQDIVQNKLQQKTKLDDINGLPPSAQPISALSRGYRANSPHNTEMNYTIETLKSPDGSEPIESTTAGNPQSRPRLRLPTHSHTPPTHTPNSKKRRRSSVYDLEDDDSPSDNSEPTRKRPNTGAERAETCILDHENTDVPEPFLHEDDHDEQTENREQATELAASTAAWGIDGNRSHYFLPRI